MIPAIVMFAEKQLVHLSAVDVVIIAFYFALVLGDRILPEGAVEYRRRLFPGRPGNDGLGGRASFLSANLGSLELMGWAGFRLSVRHSGDALVLDRRHSGDAVPRHGDDAFLLHLQDAFGSGISEVAFRRTQPRAVRGFVRVHDRADERHQHVLHGLVMKIVLGWDINFSIWVSSLTVAVYVVLGGLRSAIFNEVLQFFLIWRARC